MVTFSHGLRGRWLLACMRISCCPRRKRPRVLDGWLTRRGFADLPAHQPKLQPSSPGATLLAKVYEGPYRDVKKWIAGMRELVRSQGNSVQRLLFLDTTCPKCAAKFGKNYIVLFAQT